MSSVTEVVPKAMILAAGRGKRLQPLTDTTPKPLLPLNGKPLVEYHLEKLAQAGFKEVVINTAWLAQQFPDTLAKGERFGLEIHYSQECAGGLETAGGIINALPLLGEAPFLLINGDVFSEIDYQFWFDKAVQMRQQSARLGHLCLVPTPSFKPAGDFGLDSQHSVAAHGEWTFAGVSVLSPQLFAGRAPEFLPLAPILREAMAAQQITGEVFEGYWSDIGTLERLQAAQAYLQSKLGDYDNESKA